MNDPALKLRLVCGLLASAARLVPVPFLDDLLRESMLRYLVKRTLGAHGRSYSTKQVAPLYGDPFGCLHGCLVGALMAMVKLVLFPIRKVLVWVMAAKWLARDLSEAILLGRTLDRRLAAGHLSNEADTKARLEEADRTRRAFDNALAGTDMKLLRGVLTQALRGVSGLRTALVGALMRARKGGDADPDAMSDAQKAKVDEGADRVSAALDTPELRAFLERFDATFDENLRILEAR